MPDDWCLMTDDWLLMPDAWWLMTDCWLSSHGKCGGHGCPQADGVGECESSEFKQNLNGGPQADSFGWTRIVMNIFIHRWTQIFLSAGGRRKEQRLRCDEIADNYQKQWWNMKMWLSLDQNSKCNCIVAADLRWIWLTLNQILAD